MTRRGALRVRVQDEGGVRVEGARVEVIGLPSWAKGSGTTNGEGELVLC